MPRHRCRAPPVLAIFPPGIRFPPDDLSGTPALFDDEVLQAHN